MSIVRERNWNLFVRLCNAVSSRAIGKNFDELMSVGCSIVYKIKEPTNSVFLTFDDGPDPRTTPYILASLEKTDVTAAFFCVGHQAIKYPDIVREIVDAGHEIGNHTMSHLDLHRVLPSRIHSEVEHGRKVLEDISGQSVTMFRAPFGHFRWEMKTHDCRLICWDVAPPWQETDPGSIAACCVKNCVPGSIILLHDGLFGAGTIRSSIAGAAAAQSVELLVPLIRDRGLQFGRLGQALDNQLMQMSPSPGLISQVD
jgi:peptidoglycan/xylan/chitin deacetylase (PgdA/CDA1 family)